MAFVAIMASEAEDNNNLLKREERSAIRGKRLGPNIRKKRKNKNRKQSKNTKKKSKGKKGKGNYERKVKEKSGFLQGKSNRKVQVKLADRQCSDETIANKMQQIASWEAAIKNTKNLYDNMVDKVSVNGTIKESLSNYMSEAMNVIGTVTVFPKMSE